MARGTHLRGRLVPSWEAIRLPFIETAGSDSLRRPITLSQHRHAGYELVFLCAAAPRGGSRSP
jgi:hypothetical protein